MDMVVMLFITGLFNFSKYCYKLLDFFIYGFLLYLMGLCPGSSTLDYPLIKTTLTLNFNHTKVCLEFFFNWEWHITEKICLPRRKNFILVNIEDYWWVYSMHFCFAKSTNRVMDMLIRNKFDSNTFFFINVLQI